LEVPIQRAELEALELLLFDCGAASITLIADDPQQEDVLEPRPGATPLWDHLRLHALFDLSVDMAALRRRMERFDRNLFERIEIRFLGDEDWSKAMQQHTVEGKFGGRLRLLPKVEANAAPVAGLVDLVLDPGLAFGTGAHPTTRLCLEAIAASVEPPMRVLDFGCGSGILAIAAGLLGGQVVAVDHDPQALMATRENALYNGLNAKAGNIQLDVMGADQWHRETHSACYDLIVANILAGPLIELAGELQSALAEDGTLVLSGILPDQLDPIIAAYESTDFQLPDEDDGWIRLVGRRRGR
jgi:ribosomal protein L11 methyltransferase